MAGNRQGLTPAPVAAIFFTAAVVLWGLLHPDFRPDLAAVDPSVRENILKAGFQATKNVTSARFETIETEGGFEVFWESRQKFLAMDDSLTEKRIRRKTAGLTRQSAGLYIGPIAVVRYTRNWPPLVGDLLPYQFWMSTRMTRFVIDENANFPKAVGSKLVASVIYEDRNSDGALTQTEHRQLRCEVKSAADASSIAAALSGRAMRIECEEPLANQGRIAGSAGPLAYAIENWRTAHWYVVDHAWSIPIEGGDVVIVGDRSITRKWRSKLLDFDMDIKGNN
jgi:hypothetical protein